MNKAYFGIRASVTKCSRSFPIYAHKTSTCRSCGI